MARFFAVIQGNVLEWTLSRFADDSYAGREETGLTLDPRQIEPEAERDPASGESRVLRGGSYEYTARGTRAAFRYLGVPWYGWQDRGFRVLLPYRPEL